MPPPVAVTTGIETKPRTAIIPVMGGPARLLRCPRYVASPWAPLPAPHRRKGGWREVSHGRQWAWPGGVAGAVRFEPSIAHQGPSSAQLSHSSSRVAWAMANRLRMARLTRSPTT